MKYVSIWIIGCLLSVGVKAQQTVKLDLQHTIEIANDRNVSVQELIIYQYSKEHVSPFAERKFGMG